MVIEIKARSHIKRREEFGNQNLIGRCVLYKFYFGVNSCLGFLNKAEINLWQKNLCIYWIHTAN